MTAFDPKRTFADGYSVLPKARIEEGVMEGYGLVMAADPHRQQVLKDLRRLFQMLAALVAWVFVVTVIGWIIRQLAGPSLIGRTVGFSAALVGLAACFFFLRWVLRRL